MYVSGCNCIGFYAQFRLKAPGADFASGFRLLSFGNLRLGGLGFGILQKGP